MSNIPIVWIVMGPSGSGKTTIGRLLAERLDADFIEGDRRHPLVPNVLKMRRGVPLDASDRRLWIDILVQDLDHQTSCGIETVVACSALGRSVRDELGRGRPVCFLYPVVGRAELHRRLAHRDDHFFRDPALVAHQLAALDDIGADEPVILLDGEQPVRQVVAEAEARITERWPLRPRRWWEAASA